MTYRATQIYMDMFVSCWFIVSNDCVCMAVPDPPQHLQLSIDNAEDGTVLCSWNPPDKAHGLIREYIVRKKPSVLYSIYQHLLASNWLCVLCRWSTVKRTAQNGFPSAAPALMQKWRTCSPACSTDSGWGARALAWSCFMWTSCDHLDQFI